MATKIELALSDELSTSWDLTDPDHHVKVRKVGSDDNTFEVKEDGMYVSAKPGPDGQGGTGYDDYYTNEGLRLGYESPYSDQRAQRKICGMHYLHRLFDATLSASPAQLPTGYTRLDYLGNMGWNYVESGYVPTRNDTFETEIMFWDPGHTDYQNHGRLARYLFGTVSKSAYDNTDEWNPADGCVMMDYSSDSDYINYYRNPGMIFLTHTSETAYACGENLHKRTNYVWETMKVKTSGNNDPLGNDIIAFYDNITGAFKAGSNGIGESSKAHFWSQGDSQYQMYIFYCNFADAGYVPCKQGSHSEYPYIYNHICAMPCSMRNFVVRDTTTQVIKRYYVPCVRDSDNKAGMYELKTGVFYEEKGLENCHFEKGTVTSDTPPLPDLGDGTLTPTNFRPEIDYVLAGDMCRVDQGNGTWKYYLVTGTDNNVITSYEELGVW